MHIKSDIIFRYIPLFFSFFFLSVGLFAQKNTEKFRDSKPDGFYHTINLALNLNKGNEEYVKYLGDYRLDYYQPSLITFLVVNLEYKQGNAAVITNKGFAHWRLIFNKGALFEPEIFTQTEFNEFILLKQRYLAGAGLRISPFSTISTDSLHRFVAEFGIGAMYEYEEVDDPNQRFTRYIRSTNFASLRYTYKKFIDFFSVTYFQPYVKDVSDFRLLSENRVAFTITKNFSFFVSSMYRYDSKPPTSLKNFDLELANGITITF